MKLKNIFFVIIFVFIYMQVFANTNPVVTNVSFSLTGTTVTVTYDVADVQQTEVTISMEVSEDGGTTWDYNFGSATGHIGAGIINGTSKTITWTYNGSSSGSVRIKIIADDLVGDQIYYSGQVYNTVTIGSQTWLKENLNVGNMINSTSGGTNSDGEQTNNGIVGKYCYNNDESNCDIYGGLYQWNEAMQYVTIQGSQGICPSGWHIPTKIELETLKAEVSNSSNALKAIGQGSGSGSGTNTSGFSALFSGYRDRTTGNFFNLGNASNSLSSTRYGLSLAYVMSLNYNNNSIPINTNYLPVGLSIRCIKN
ncbi:MAG: FISUMP domain-containing protein [Melioribacteraceae bacterium]